MADDATAVKTGMDARGLTYPMPQTPAGGEAIEVAPGVLWMRLTLPFQLNHVNVYALQDGDGWTVVDTGLRTPDSIAAWEAALAGALEGRPIRRLVLSLIHI